MNHFLTNKNKRVGVEGPSTLRASFSGGKGHGSDKAVLLGLLGEAPENVDPSSVDAKLAQIRASQQLKLLGLQAIRFDERSDLVFHRRKSLPFHPNGMRFAARDKQGSELSARIYYSIGGGFVVDEQAAGVDRIKFDDSRLPFPFKTGNFRSCAFITCLATVK